MEKLKLDSTTVSKRKKWSWTPQNKARAADIMVVFKAMKKYPGHSVTAHSIYELASLTEKLGNFDRALKYYQILM